MQNLTARALSLSLTAAVITSSLAACGRAMQSADAQGNSQVTLPAATLDQPVKDNAFPINSAGSSVTITTSASGTGSVEFKGSAVVETKNYAFDLKGRIGSDGMAILVPDDQTEPFRGRAFCLSMDSESSSGCSQFFIDIYFKKSATQFLHNQFIRNATDMSGGAILMPDDQAKPGDQAMSSDPAKPPAESAAKPTTPVTPTAPAAKPAAPVAPVTPVAPLKPAVKPAAPPKTTAPKKAIPRPSRPPSASAASGDDTGIASTDDEEEGDDAPPPDGAYVGLQDLDQIQSLFSNSTDAAVAGAQPSAGPLAPDMAGEPADRPTDQAVGGYSNGHLEHASSLDPSSKNYFIPRLDLKHYFGAYVAIRFIENFAIGVAQSLPGFRLRVDDIAQEKGGQICSWNNSARLANGRCRQAAHASHEIGLDADIGYLLDVPYTSVPMAVAKGNKMSSHMRKALQWNMFKMMNRSQLISTVFVAPAVKNGFCAYAKSITANGTRDDKNEMAATLTMLRPLASHTTHFHLRFRCTKYNPRCRDESLAGRALGCP